jgi:hypothetical protein
MEQIKSNFKTAIIMETKINLDKPINLSILNTKDFVLWFKQEIKNLVEDQKISKRDRKDVRHPCPEKRKYNTYEAYFRVLGNRETLRIYYALYYTLRHNKDFDWAKYEYSKDRSFTSDFVVEVENFCKPIDPEFVGYYEFKKVLGNLVYKYAEKVVREGAEKALCNC